MVELAELQGVSARIFVVKLKLPVFLWNGSAGMAKLFVIISDSSGIIMAH